MLLILVKDAKTSSRMKAAVDAHACWFDYHQTLELPGQNCHLAYLGPGFFWPTKKGGLIPCSSMFTRWRPFFRWGSPYLGLLRVLERRRTAVDKLPGHAGFWNVKKVWEVWSLGWNSLTYVETVCRSYSMIVRHTVWPQFGSSVLFRSHLLSSALLFLY